MDPNTWTIIAVIAGLIMLSTGLNVWVTRSSFAALGARIDALEQTMNAWFDQIDKRFDQTER